MDFLMLLFIGTRHFKWVFAFGLLVFATLWHDRVGDFLSITGYCLRGIGLIMLARVLGERWRNWRKLRQCSRG